MIKDVQTMQDLITALFRIGAIQEGEFTLRKGVTSPIYIDLRRIISYPELFQYVIDLMWQHVEGKDFDHVGGVPYSAIPIATGLALLYQKPMLMMRKENADVSSRTVEGVYKQGDIILLIEDIATTGTNILQTVDALLKEGLIINDVVVFVDREQGARDQLAQKGIRFHAVFTLSQILQELQTNGHIDEATYNRIVDFLQVNQC